MANLLKNMKITSVDLVEAGANQEADIEFFKERGAEMQNPNDSQMLSVIEDLQKRLEVLEKSGDAPEVSDEVQEDLAEVAEDSEGTDIPSEDGAEVADACPVGKSVGQDEIKKLIDIQVASIRKENEAIRKQNEELKKTLELVEYEEIAKKYSDIGEDPKVLAKRLYDFKQLGGSYYDQYVEVLDKSLNVQKETGVFKEFGSGRTMEDSRTVDAVLKSYTDQGLTEYQAYAKAAEEHPELLKEYDEYYGG